MTIANYCKKNLSKSEYFLDYINNNPSFILTYLEDGYIPFDKKQNIKIYLKLQEYENKVFYKQIKEISKFDDEIVGLKGYFLQKVYYPPKHIRLYNDIDVLVKTNDSYKFYKNAKSHGYTIAPQKNILYRILCNDFIAPLFKVLSTKTNVHIQLIKKDYHLLELHSNINKHRSIAYRATFNIKEMVSNAIKIDLGDFRFKILSPEDNILYLMFHTIKHISYIELYENAISVNLQKFYDVAQIISNEKIDWDLFYCNAIKYNIFPYVTLFIKMFNDIYTNTIPTSIYQRLIDYSNFKNFKCKPIFDKVINLSPDELIIGDYRRLPEIMKTYEKAKQVKNPGLVWGRFFLKNCFIYNVVFVAKSLFSNKWLHSKYLKNSK